MTGLLSTLNEAKGVIVAIAAILGVGITAETRYFPMDDGVAMQSADKVRAIYDLVEIAQRDGPQAWICRAIDEEHLALCTELPGHYLCTDPDAFPAIKAKAGC